MYAEDHFTAIRRRRIDKMKDQGRDNAPFVLQVDVNGEEETFLARAVIDAVAKAKPNSVKGTYIHSCTLSATMSPPVSVDLREFAT